MPYTFEYADKTELEVILPECFRLFYENMREVASLGDYGTEFAAWYSEVCPAVKNTVREIILMYDGDAFVGFFQYYVARGIFMMEEIQIKRELHRSGIFREFYTWLVAQLPSDIHSVRAYAHRPNTKSQAILRHLGLEECGNEGELLAFCGEYKNLREKYK